MDDLSMHNVDVQFIFLFIILCLVCLILIVLLRYTRTRVHVILYHIVGFMFSFVELIYFYGKYL